MPQNRIDIAKRIQHVERGTLNLDEDVNQKLVSWKIPGNELTKEKHCERVWLG